LVAALVIKLGSLLFAISPTVGRWPVSSDSVNEALNVLSLPRF
jgi:hypothetical protein